MRTVSFKIKLLIWWMVDMVLMFFIVDKENRKLSMELIDGLPLGDSARHHRSRDHRSRAAGLGALGLQVAKHLAEQGATNLVLTGRSGANAAAGPARTAAAEGRAQ